jgi:hypothetical protein
MIIGPPPKFHGVRGILVRRPDCGTACGRAGFTAGSSAVSHTNMLRRIVRVVWERRRLTSVEEQWHGHRGHDKFIGRGR